MAKFTLDIEYEYDFILIGVCCHARDYKLCWAINNFLGFEFSRQNNLIYTSKSNSFEFSHYIYEDQETRKLYTLLSNRGVGGMLIPEQKQTDYFLKVSGVYSKPEIDDLIAKLKQIELIIAVYLIDIENLKSKQNLLIE